jgi:serine/threonine protein kinase
MASDALGDAPTLRVRASLGDSGDECTVRKDLKALRRSDRLDHFVVLGLLGEGGMGSVYSAYDPDLDRKVAIKLLRSSTPDGTASEGQQRLLREAQAMAKLGIPTSWAFTRWARSATRSSSPWITSTGAASATG